MNGAHLELDALADLLAGEGESDDVTHLGSCAGCAGRLDELAEAEHGVVAALAALPAPVLPPGLADRLSAALAAEPTLTPIGSDTGPGAAEAADGGAAPAERPSSRPDTVTPFPSARTGRHRWLPAAAAGLVLLAGAGAAVVTGGPRSTDESASRSAGGSAAESSAGPGLPTSSTGADYAGRDGALAAALPALLAGDAPQLSGQAAQPQRQDDDPMADGPAPAAPAPGSATPPSSESSAEQLDPVEESARTAAEDPLAPLRAPEGLASCLAALLPPDDDAVRPLALDYAAYAGQPALVVVLPASGAPDKLDVFVVGAGCSLGNDRTLFFTRLDRPS